MTQLILIRHGETVWNQQGRMQGHSDSPLSATGVRQARQLARRLQEIAFSTLYSSDSGRAHQTAGSVVEENVFLSSIALQNKGYALMQVD